MNKEILDFSEKNWSPQRVPNFKMKLSICKTCDGVGSMSEKHKNCKECHGTGIKSEFIDETC